MGVGPRDIRRIRLDSLVDMGTPASNDGVLIRDVTDGKIKLADVSTIRLTIEEVQDNLGTGFIVGGTSIGTVYDDVANTLTINLQTHNHTESEITDLDHLTIEEVQDNLGVSFIVGGTSIGAVYDDVANTLTINLEAHNHTESEITDLAHYTTTDFTTDHNAVSGGHVTNGNTHDHAGGDGGQVDHGGLAGLADVADHPDYATLDGARAFTGAVEFPDGTAALPSIKFTGDTTSGLSLDSGEVSVSIGGTQVAKFGGVGNSGLIVTGDVPGVRFNEDGATHNWWFFADGNDFYLRREEFGSTTIFVVDDDDEDSVKFYSPIDTISGLATFKGGDEFSGDTGLTDGYGHIQVGASGTANIGIDSNGIQARDGIGGASHLDINQQGGGVTFGDVVSGVTPTADAHFATKGYVDGQEGVLDVLYYTADGTFSKGNYPDASAVRVICTGAGGGGGGADVDNGTFSSSGGGGGAGVTCISVLDVATLGSSETVTVGSGGSGGVANGGTSAGNGGTSSFGNHVSAEGGGGGTCRRQNSRLAMSEGGNSGNAGISTGDLRISGSGGQHGWHDGSDSTGEASGGLGGSSYWGGGASGGETNSATSNSGGTNTRGWGSGGGGAATEKGGADKTGGDGADGIVVVEVLR